MKPPFRILALCAGVGALLAVSCGKTGHDPARARKGGAPGTEPARAVRVARAEVRPMEQAIAVTGTLGAQEQSTLSAKVAGRLARVLVDVGSVVRQGELLAQIEPRDYELGLQRAVAALAQARAALGLPLEGEEDRIELENVTAVKQAKAVWEEAAKNRARVNALAGAGIASQSEWDTAEANHAVAQAKYDTAREDARTRLAALAGRRAELETARQQVTDAAVRAPYDGAIQARLANTGEYLAEGAPLLKIVKTDPLRLRLEVAERECGLVGTGQLVRLMIERNTNTFAGRIARLSPAITEQNRMLVVEADVPSRGVLRPGQFARAQIVVQEREPGLSVPASALLTFAGIEKVIGVKEGKAVEKTVTTGRRGPDWVEVLSGLASGEAVVLEPGGLRTGQPVIPTEPPRAPQTAGMEPASGR